MRLVLGLLFVAALVAVLVVIFRRDYTDRDRRFWPQSILGAVVAVVVGLLVVWMLVVVAVAAS